MKIRHLLENDDELFWESLQDHGWVPHGDVLVSARDQHISVDRDRRLYYNGHYTGTGYTDANYAELLRFERDPEVQTKLCSRSYQLLSLASEAVQIATVP